LRDQSCTPLPAEAAKAVIAEAEETVRRAAAREDARARRKEQWRRAERDRKAAEQWEQRRADEARLRAEADSRASGPAEAGHGTAGSVWREHPGLLRVPA
jgi:hypothetical protein